MKFEVDEKDGVVVISTRGKMMAGPKLDDFHDKIKGLVRIGARRIVIDLGKTEWMDSRGLGILISCLTTLRKADGALRLARPTKKIKQSIVIAKLTEYFKNYKSVEDAVSSFASTSRKRSGL